MAKIKPAELIREAFPSIEDELFTYVTAVLDCAPDDFTNSEDVYEAVGNILHQVDAKKSTNDVRDLCQKLLDCIHINHGCQNGVKKNEGRLLAVPVQLMSLTNDADGTTAEEYDGIWVDRRSATTRVDQKKLEKAEAKIREKQDKRLLDSNDSTEKVVAPNPFSDGPSVSQATNRKDVNKESRGANKSKDIVIENFDVSFGDRKLLESANLMLAHGRRYGLCGRNGMGKTTLLRMIALRELSIPSHISVLHVEQEVQGDETTALDCVLRCDTVRQDLLDQEKRLSASGAVEELSQVHAQLAEIEADKAPARAAMILAGLGFPAAKQSWHTKQFSGGWRMRLALAGALFTVPDLLLLDEPTNMLDMKAIIWLQSYLLKWPKTLFIVSHDRNFLDQVVTDVVELRARRLTAYRGNYSVYVKTRDELITNQQREYEAQLQLRQHTQEFIDKFRYNAKRASLVQSKIKMLEKLEKLEPVEKEAEIILHFPQFDDKVQTGTMMHLDDISFGYTPDVPLLSKVNVTVNADSRICVVGDNGSGKTTLLKLLLGTLEPKSGHLVMNRAVRVGYFSQHHVDQLDMKHNSVELLATRLPGKPVEYYRHALGRFGVSGELALQKINTLSGGQKSRVAFASMCISNPNLMVLDEPTNHLDVETVDALARAIAKFQGGVILVSHDEHLVRSVCKELWYVSLGSVSRLEGLDDYKRVVEKELAEVAS